LVKLGVAQPAQIEAALTAADSLPLGQKMVLTQGLSNSDLTRGLHEQLAQRYEWACRLPGNSGYRFFSGQDALPGDAARLEESE
jgi:hypothetical protein